MTRPHENVKLVWGTHTSEPDLGSRWHLSLVEAVLSKIGIVLNRSHSFKLTDKNKVLAAESLFSDQLLWTFINIRYNKQDGGLKDSGQKATFTLKTQPTATHRRVGMTSPSLLFLTGTFVVNITVVNNINNTFNLCVTAIIVSIWCKIFHLI